MVQDKEEEMARLGLGIGIRVRMTVSHRRGGTQGY